MNKKCFVFLSVSTTIVFLTGPVRLSHGENPAFTSPGLQQKAEDVVKQKPEYTSPGLQQRVPNSGASPSMQRPSGPGDFVPQPTQPGIAQVGLLHGRLGMPSHLKYALGSCAYYFGIVKNYGTTPVTVRVSTEPEVSYCGYPGSSDISMAPGTQKSYSFSIWIPRNARLPTFEFDVVLKQPGGADFTDITPRDNREHVTIPLGRAEFEIIGVRRLDERANITRGGDIPLSVKVRNTGDASFPIRVSEKTDYVSMSRGTIYHLSPGGSSDLRYTLKAAPHLITADTLNAEIVLVTAANLSTPSLAERSWEWLDDIPSNNIFPVRFHMNLYDMAVTNISPAVFRLAAGSPFRLSTGVTLRNTGDQIWGFDGTVTAILYEGTPDSGFMRKISSTIQRTPSGIAVGSERSLTLNFSRYETPITAGKWYTALVTFSSRADGNHGNNNLRATFLISDRFRLTDLRVGPPTMAVPHSR